MLVLCVLLAAPPTDVAALIARLGSDSYAERVAATKALDKAGAIALRALRKARAGSDIEVRRRAASILRSIEGRLYRETAVFGGHRSGVNAVAWSPDGTRIASGDGNFVRLLDPVAKRETASNGDHGDRVMALAFSPDGKILASASEDRTVRTWDARTLEARLVMKGHKDDVRAMAFTADGREIVSASSDGTVRRWDAATGKPLGSAAIPKPDDAVFSLALSPDGKRALIGSRNLGVPLIELATGKKIGELDNRLGTQALCVRWSRDGKTAITASPDGMVRIWDMKALKCVRLVEAHREGATCVALSRDGKRIASGGMDKKVRLTEMDDNEPGMPFKGHTSAVWSVAFSPDGRFVASAGNDGTVRVWKTAE